MSTPTNGVVDTQDHRSMKGVGLFFTSLLCTFQIIVVALRIFTRKFICTSIGLEDHLIALATLVTAGVLVLSLIQYDYGFGRHIWDVGDNDKVALIKLNYAINTFYPVALGLTKLSILAFFYRTFKFVGSYSKLIIAAAILHLSAMIAFMLAYILKCLPLYTIWSLDSIPGTRCINMLALSYVVCIFNSLSDFWVLALPIPSLLNTKLLRAEKIQAMILLFLGGMACFASVMRFYEVIRSSTSVKHSYDWTRSHVRISIWSQAEFTLAAIATSIPAIKPLFRRCFPWLCSNNTKNSTKYSERYSNGTYTMKRYNSSRSAKDVQVSLTPKGYENELENIVISKYGKQRDDGSSSGSMEGPPETGILRTTKVQTHVENV